MEQQFDSSYLRPGLLARASAVGLAAIGLGIGVLLTTWGISLLWRYAPPEIAVRVANPEVRVVQEEPFVVEQNEPLTVEQNKPFKVEQDDPFMVEQPPSLVLTDKNEGATTATGEVIKRKVTVFSELKHGLGEVVTGWIYENGSGGVPSRQYCYYIAPNGDGSAKQIDIASDGGRLPLRRTSLVPNLEGALAKCQWWRS